MSKDKDSLYKNVEYALDTLWYDSSIPDAGNSSILKAMDIVHPNEEDSDTVLEAKLYLIWGIANTLPDLENESIKEVKQCLDDNERLLSDQYAKESYQVLEERLSDLDEC
ncbi:hypothetical protein [Lactobacillus phage Lbab1]|nr:hypothetical protein [Lactobacillus phage Lbab1]